MNSQDKKAAIDWERIEADYRAGILSLREIALACGVSHVAIQKRAKRDGWERDLSGKIRAKAEALVTKAEVTESVTSTAGAVTERLIIEANAARIAQIRSEHRADITRARALSLRLMAELEEQTNSRELFEKLAELLSEESEQAAAKRQEAFDRVISLPGRTKTLKDLAETLKTLIALEREAYGLGVVATPPPGSTGASEGQRPTDEFLAAFAHRFVASRPREVVPALEG